MPNFEKEKKIAVDSVYKASEITEWFKKRGFKSYLKSDSSPVTLADYASQIFILSNIKKQFPDDEIIAEEENGDFLSQEEKDIIKQCFDDLDLGELEDLNEIIKYRGDLSSRQWTIDPIDGTAGYQEKLTYAIGVGLMLESIPKISAVAVPNYNQETLALFSAEENQGTQVSLGGKAFKPVQVSQVEDLKEVRLCHSLHYDKPWVLRFAEKYGVKNFIQIDSMAKFCMVADGSADLYIKPLDVRNSFSWDFMPGDLIVREAGGNVTDLNGNSLRFKKNKCLWTAPGIFASNFGLQNKILNLFKNDFPSDKSII
ncbi:MAG: 3'(2'),5'-bisphosphate nucleotidase CysQ [Candidatus Thorarchaeota archaeon]